MKLGVASREEVTRRALKAFRRRKQGARISFATPELLWTVHTAKRWRVLKAVAGRSPLTIREVARRVGRQPTIHTAWETLKLLANGCAAQIASDRISTRETPRCGP